MTKIEFGRKKGRTLFHGADLLPVSVLGVPQRLELLLQALRPLGPRDALPPWRARQQRGEAPREGDDSALAVSLAVKLSQLKPSLDSSQIFQGC